MSTAPGWIVRLCRASPGAKDVAELARSQGADVIWCSPACCGELPEEDDVSVFDDGTDLTESAEETRGGEHPDWARARPGKPLPELPPDPDQDGVL